MKEINFIRAGTVFSHQNWEVQIPQKFFEKQKIKL